MIPEVFSFTLDNADEPTREILVRGCGAAGIAVEAALEDVTEAEPRRRSLAFVVCDPDSHQSVTSATWLANTLRDEEIFTVGVALGPCDAYFSDAVDLLVRIPADDAAAVLRPLVGATAGESLLPFDVVDVRWLFSEGGDAIAHRRNGITAMADLHSAVDDVIDALRGRGALTDDSDWLLLVLRYGPEFAIGQSAEIATAGTIEERPRTALFGTFRDPHYGDTAELIAIARVSAAR